jgi:hypothetical protein
MSDERCRAAVAALDRALDDRPDKVYNDLAAAVCCLVQLRDELIARVREGGSADYLRRCNAILSMVIGGEYPLAGIRRDRVRKARDHLAELCESRPQQRSGYQRG